MKNQFTQCINGMIQGETFLYKHRGYITEEQYNTYWDELEQDGCRMYSNKHPDDLTWMEYSEPINRRNALFMRFMWVNIIKDSQIKEKITREAAKVLGISQSQLVRKNLNISCRLYDSKMVQMFII